jgi:hypothetical protein
MVMLASASAALADGWGVEALMTDLHGIKSSSAHFVERKYIHLLTTPLESTGTLKYSAPDKLEKITTGPVPEAIRLDGDRLSGTHGADGDKFSVSLSEQPEISAVVEGIRATLAGDLATLQRVYLLTFSGPQSKWQLDMVPRSETVRRLVSAIRISGSGTALYRVEMLENDGDRSDMDIRQDQP